MVNSYSFIRNGVKQSLVDISKFFRSFQKNTATFGKYVQFLCGFLKKVLKCSLAFLNKHFLHNNIEVNKTHC